MRRGLSLEGPWPLLPLVWVAGYQPLEALPLACPAREANLRLRQGGCGREPLAGGIVRLGRADVNGAFALDFSPRLTTMQV